MIRHAAIIILTISALAACATAPSPETPSPLCAEKDQKKDGGLGGTGNAPVECPE